MRKSMMVLAAVLAAGFTLISAPKAEAHCWWTCGGAAKPGWFAAPYYGYNYGPSYEYGTEYHFAEMYRRVPRYVGKIRYVDTVFYYPSPRYYVRPYYRY